MPDEGQAIQQQGTEGQSSTTTTSAQPTGWRESLGDLGKEKVFDVFKGKDWTEVGPAMAKQYVEAQKLIGGSIRIPKPDASPEEKQKWLNDIYNKLGRPEKPEQYKIPEVDGIKWNEEQLKPALETFHKLGFTAEQAEGVLKLYAQVLGQNVENARKRHNSAVETLKKEWGNNYDRKVVVAQRVINQFGGEELKKFLDDSGAGDNPHLVKALAEIGEILAEDGFISGRVEGEMSKADIMKKMEAMLLDPSHPINNLRHPGHAAALEEYKQLNRSLASARD